MPKQKDIELSETEFVRNYDQSSGSVVFEYTGYMKEVNDLIINANMAGLNVNTLPLTGLRDEIVRINLNFPRNKFNIFIEILKNKS